MNLKKNVSRTFFYGFFQVNDKRKTVSMGPKDTDEMCVFYVMYYVKESDLNRSHYDRHSMPHCYNPESKSWKDDFRKIPRDASKYNGVSY